MRVPSYAQREVESLPLGTQRNNRRRAGVKKAADGGCGAVTAVQRFGSFLNLNVHLHDLALDGVYVRDANTGELRFRRARPPTDEDLEGVLNRTRLRLGEHLKRKGFEVGDYSVRDPREEGEGPTSQDIFLAAWEERVQGTVVL